MGGVMKITFPELPEDPAELEAVLKEREQQAGDIRPGAEARILWANPEYKQQTAVSLVYLHGFTASHGEGYPVHEQFARRFGLNLYLSRLEGHGLQSPDAFSGLTPQSLLDSAARAVSVGQRLGNRVIVMGTSTGASLALFLASVIRQHDLFKGLILFSPLVDFYGITSLLLTHRTTRRLLSIFPGKRFHLQSKFSSPKMAEIWDSSHLLEGSLALGELIEVTMTPDTFTGVSCPVFTGYYFKNRKEQDKVVSVSSILKMHEQLSTEDRKKRIVNFPKADSHVICSPLRSGAATAVKEATFRFSEEILGLNPL